MVRIEVRAVLRFFSLGNAVARLPGGVGPWELCHSIRRQILLRLGSSDLDSVIFENAVSVNSGKSSKPPNFGSTEPNRMIFRFSERRLRA